jgi:RNA polymerase sigma-70 factor (ECF subfamily)
VLSADERKELEDEIRGLCESGQHDAATAAALQAYGSELMGFLVSASQDEALADDAFGLFSENLWKGLPKFEWNSTLRTWAYVIARNALHMVRRGASRRREVALSDEKAAELVAEIRTRTRTFMRTETKDAVAQLRLQLDPEDQEILILRIGRQMSWIDIARVMHEGEPLEEADLKRSAARLRQRFNRAKARLKELVQESGLKDR